MRAPFAKCLLLSLGIAAGCALRGSDLPDPAIFDGSHYEKDPVINSSLAKLAEQSTADSPAPAATEEQQQSAASSTAAARQNSESASQASAEAAGQNAPPTEAPQENAAEQSAATQMPAGAEPVTPPPAESQANAGAQPPPPGASDDPAGEPPQETGLPFPDQEAAEASTEEEAGGPIATALPGEPSREETGEGSKPKLPPITIGDASKIISVNIPKDMLPQEKPPAKEKKKPGPSILSINRNASRGVEKGDTIPSDL